MSFILDPRFSLSAGGNVVTIAEAIAAPARIVLAGGDAVAAPAAKEVPAVAGAGVVTGAVAPVLTAKQQEKEARKALAMARAAAPAPPPKEKEKKKAVEKLEFVNTTPSGDKKDMSVEMLPAYHPTVVEAAWDAWWTKSGYYTADAEAALKAGEANRFVMVIPPPNVTGSLHIGHALTDAIEDCMTRWNRMCGRPTLWLPGTDHAGIATQAVVEKRLMKERGLTRHDLGREAFLKEVFAWKEQYGNRIYDQMRHLGVSVDWTRSRFTMDEQLSAAVSEAFVRLHETKLIYRATRLVNWCCRLKTAISDIEVDYLDIEKRTRIPVPGHDPKKTYEFGCLTSFAYKVVGSDEELVVATTRPETMLGDTAVAVHPADPRYTHLHGKMLVHPFFPDRKVPVITDAELVDMSFGTGAVKITPAHDPNDYKCGKKHGLQFITVFTEDGTISEAGGEAFKGMMRFDARDAVVKALTEKGLFRDKVDNKMRLGICSRSGDIIEPLIKPQWYMDCNDLAKSATDAVRKGELKIVPEMHQATWFSWLDNSQDWCISRQLWWGHRIPAYFVSVKGRPRAEGSDPAAWVVARSEAEAYAKAAEANGVAVDQITLEQDEDVLDTWFSSGLFPFATLGWPNVSHPDFQAFYPNTILETGHDILFFWVARMVMMGIALTGKLPFKTVYLHAMVRDKYGRKMSKSLGNVIDPMEVIYGCDLEALHQKIRDGNLPPKEVEKGIAGQKLDYPDGIPECGADALRFGLLAYTVQGRDVNLDISRVVAYRQFCNKLWNATRFALIHLEPAKFTPAPLLDMIDELSTSTQLATRDRWILSRLNHAVNTVTTALTDHVYGAATTAIYEFWLYELCDYYLELMKPLMQGDVSSAGAAGGDLATAQRLSRNVLYLCLDHGLRMLHPIMPFVTEELWQRLPGRGLAWRKSGEVPDPASIMICPYPTPIPHLTRPDVETAFVLFQNVLRAGRNLLASADVARAKDAVFFLVASEGYRATATDLQRDFVTLLKAGAVNVVGSQGEVDAGCSVAVVNEGVSIHLQLKGLVDPAVELKKLGVKTDKIHAELARLAKKMAMPGYADKTPEEVRTGDAELVISLNKQLEVLATLKAQYESWTA